MARLWRRVQLGVSNAQTSTEERPGVLDIDVRGRTFHRTEVLMKLAGRIVQLLESRHVSSSPIMAGIFSLLIDLRLQQGLKPLGFVAPRVWQVNEQYPEEAFQSVEKGNSKTACQTGFPASKKWSKFFWRFWYVSCFCCCFTDIPCLRSCRRVGPTTVPEHDRAFFQRFLI